MTCYMVRRISNQEIVGLFEVDYFMHLFDKISEFADPYQFEYSATPFNKHTGKPGFHIMWRRFEQPFKQL